MARSTQFIGHTADVAAFLETCEKLEKCGEVTGMFDEHVCDLHKYKDKYGNVWKERIQAEPWSSGPMIFLCIQGEFDGTTQTKGWTVNSSLKGEYDPVAGEYYV